MLEKQNSGPSRLKVRREVRRSRGNSSPRRKASRDTSKPKGLSILGLGISRGPKANSKGRPSISVGRSTISREPSAI